MSADDKSYTGVEDPSILHEYAIQPSTFETIDQALYDWVNSDLNIFSETNKGFKKIPVLWMSAERSHQIKADRALRDDEAEALILPLISVDRTSVVKSPTSKGIFYGNIPPVPDAKGGSIVVARRIKQDKTSNFANVNALNKRRQANFPKKNKKVVYQTMSIPMPVYVDMFYNITLRAEYQQQINDMVTPFITKTGGINKFLLKKDGHMFEGFIQEDFSQGNNVATLDEEERIYKTEVTIKVLAYLIGEDKNQEQPKVVVRENAVEVKIPRERVILGETPPWIDKRGFYRS
tara:strand:+ start:8610 stop:9482 length:873 start_codon:yes stop_codon:yes gene_type:complete